MFSKKLAPTYFVRLNALKTALGKGNKLLDAGCSRGELAMEKSTDFEKIYGIDLNTEEIETAKIGAAKNVFFKVASLEKIPFKEKEFDALVSSEVLEHLKKPEKAVKEFNRVLKKKGRLVVTVPNRNFPFTFDPINFLLMNLSGKHLKIGIMGFGHERLFNEKQLRQLLESNGFRVKKTMRLSHYFIGLMENYWVSLLQPLVKSDPQNKAEIKRKLSVEKKPNFWMAKARDLIIFVDGFFSRSNASINLLMVAEKERDVK